MMRFTRLRFIRWCLVIMTMLLLVQFTLYRYSGSPRESLYGDMGRPVHLSGELQEKSKKEFTKHQFDVVVSDLIGLHRNLPDHRDAKCPNIEPSDRLAAWKTSVIIVFHNEAWSTLLRTVNSVIHRTPPNLLEEIILVDDASTEEELGRPLEIYLSSLSVPCHLERMGNRSGLVQARLRGANRSLGKTLTFLDAHCEASHGWLEPLLDQIAQDERRVVCPIIDVIKEDTFEYILGASTIMGIFDWQLSFHWNPLAPDMLNKVKKNPSLPVRSPAMAGGLFTMSRDYFYALGSYDEGMIVWGGENIEMSIRIWQCGGELLIHPCSRVGHVFRKVSPYVWPGGVNHVLWKNSLRTVMVWLDEYKDFYIKYIPNAMTTDYGDISNRVRLRNELKCKSFRWYLENINPGSIFPIDFYAIGEIRNKVPNRCMDTQGHPTGHDVALMECTGRGGTQLFVVTTKGEIQAATGCLDGMNGAFAPVRIRKCTRDATGSQIFIYSSGQLVHKLTNLCVTTAKKADAVELRPCENKPVFQWVLPTPTIPQQQLT